MQDEYIDDCPICGALLAPNTEYPWHLEHEDCRTIRQPIEKHEHN